MIDLVISVIARALGADASTVGVAGFGWTGAIALMLMHLSVAACGVAALNRFLPLPDRARAAVA